MKFNRRNTIHGFTSRKGRTPEYSSWMNMRQRCSNPKMVNYQYYGGRGVVVCSFLNASILNFVQIVGLRPNKGMTIDRKDNSGHYSCGSCGECISQGWRLNIEWSDWRHQSRNRRSNVIIKINGENRIAGDVARERGIDPSSFYKKIKAGKVIT